MISEEQAKRYCSEDISLIENYAEAVADQTQTWDIHHRLEIQGQFVNSAELLTKCGLYYKVPAWQLVFLTHAEHIRLHSSNMSEDTRRKISETCKDRPKSEDTRRKISETLKGRPKSEETKRKISETLKGRPLSEEHRRKLSEAFRGRPLSEEIRRKISEVKKGRRLPEETKRKISEASKGRPKSEETKHKMSEARKKYWRDRRKLFEARRVI